LALGTPSAIAYLAGLPVVPVLVGCPLSSSSNIG
jgi:hypothetical protein